MPSNWFAAGAIAAALGVVLGAFGAHGLKARVSVESLAVFETGVRYHLVHALALLAVGWAAARWPGGLVTASGACFVSGLLLFSGSLYALTFGAPRWFGAITPLGGLSFIAGWLLLAAAAIRGA